MVIFRRSLQALETVTMFTSITEAVPKHQRFERLSPRFTLVMYRYGFIRGTGCGCYGAQVVSEKSSHRSIEGREASQIAQQP